VTKSGRFVRALAAIVAVAAVGCHAAPFYEQSYLRASHNWAFRDRYPGADNLLNAFDYGHAILYETLITKPASVQKTLDGEQFRFITGSLLVNPPHVPLDEAAVGPLYVRMLPEVREMFDWAHLLHRQVYDVWADPRIPLERKDARVAELLRYYKSRPDLAFSSRPKSMELMEGQPYSLAFRRESPKFNGLIWSYHWMQMALYDGMIAATSDAERATNITRIIARFEAMHDETSMHLPTLMPMTAAVAPRFAERYPELSIVFDNLHSLHDVVSDILVSPVVPQRLKREAILHAAAAYRDSTTAVTSVAEWGEMATMMGAERMGGVAVPARQ
jgi:hypothetical protein